MGKDKAKHSSSAAHVRLYRYMWPALLGRLDGNSFKALFYMLTFEKGDNNGQLFMSARMLAKGIGVDKKTALRCLQNLDRQGFIRPEQLGYFSQKGGPATAWRLTFLPANGRPATNEWRSEPCKRKSWEEIFPATGGEVPPKHQRDGFTGGAIRTVEATRTERSGGIIRTQSITIGDDVPNEFLRSEVREWWRLARPKDRIKLAKHHGLEINQLLDFMGGAPLPLPKLLAIRATFQSSEVAA